MKLSIVATLYKSAPYVVEFCNRCAAAAEAIAHNDFEIVLVNDGSPDDSLEIAEKLTQQHDYILTVDLARNFGHHKAMMTGLDFAQGERVLLIDSDLEEEPEWLIEFARIMDENQSDVVYGVQQMRKGGTGERLTGEWFYRFFNKITGMDLPKNVVTARLMSRRFVNALLAHKEREIFIAGLWHITGFTQTPHEVVKHNSSQTTYTLRAKMSLLVNSVTSFSNKPLIGIFYIGLTIFVLSALYICTVLVQWLFFTKPLDGWTSVIASIWLLGGMVISFLGIIGVYLSKVFTETKQRPYTIVRQVYGGKKP